MLIPLIGSAVCIGLIGIIYPHSTWSHAAKTKYKWKKMMRATNIKNNLDETFQLEEVKYKNGYYTIKASIPTGLTVEKLQEYKKDMEITFGGDVDIRWEKYDCLAVITINTNSSAVEHVLKSNL